MTALAWLIAIPLLGGVLAWLADRWGAAWPRWIALAALAADLGVLGGVWGATRGALELAPGGPWLGELVWPWIPRFGIEFRLALDGLSLVLVALTLSLGLAATLSAWTEIRDRVGAFHLNLLWTLAGAIGVFLALDLFLFFLLWEVMLVPMFFLIALWGHEHRLPAAIKFMIFTQGSGLLLLTATIALALLHLEATGTLTFAYGELLGSPIAPVRRESSCCTWSSVTWYFGKRSLRRSSRCTCPNATPGDAPIPSRTRRYWESSTAMDPVMTMLIPSRWATSRAAFSSRRSAVGSMPRATSLARVRA